MIKELLQEGFALKNKHHYKHAIEVFYKALEEDNSSCELMLEIAEIYYLMHNEEKALSYIEQILNIEPSHIEALKLLKKIFINKNALAEAEQTAKNIYCVSRDSEDLAEIFQLLNRQGKYDEIFEYHPDFLSVPVKLEQARALYYKQDFAGAEKLLQEILAEAPNDQSALLLLGQVYYAENKKDCCIEIADKLTYDSKNPGLLNFLGLINGYCNNYAKASENFLQAVKLDRTNGQYYYNLANVYFKQGDTALAKKFYNLAIAVNPENPNYHFALANLYYSEKHYKRALEELQGDFAEANLLKAVILYDTGYLALAKKELEKLEKACPDNPIVIEYKAKIDAELGLK